jgi:hypothetical protein
MRLFRNVAAVVAGGALLAGAVVLGSSAATAGDVVPMKQEQKASVVAPMIGVQDRVMATTTATAMEPRKLCEYESPQGCVGWYPNANTCRDISHHGTPAQIRACLLWSGFGSRG